MMHLLIPFYYCFVVGVVTISTTTTTFINAQSSSPINDECVNAIIVDPTSSSNMTIFGNTTNAVITSIYDIDYQGLFYKIEKNISAPFTNVTSGIVCSNTNDYFPLVILLSGTDCDNQNFVDQFIEYEECLGFDFPNVGTDTYRLFVSLVDKDSSESVEGTFDMTLNTQIGYDYSPVNDECTGAIMFDPLVGYTFSGTKTDSESSYLYYTFEVGNVEAMNISISVCGNMFGTEFYVATGDCEFLNYFYGSYVEGPCGTTSFITPYSEMTHIIQLFVENESTYNITITGEVTTIPEPPDFNCGLFGLNIFCFGRDECGFFKRLFNIGGCIYK